MSNSNKKMLPDTPWHVGYTKKQEDDPRRHKSRCIYLFNGRCTCGQCAAYTLKCPGSSHCSYYAESFKQDDEKKKSQQTIEEEAQERAKAYAQTYMKKWKADLKENRRKKYLKKYRFYPLIKCPICGEKVCSKTLDLKICSYCEAKFRPYTENSYLKYNDCFFLKRR